MSKITDRIIQTSKGYNLATSEAQFIKAINDKSITSDQFNKWLAQDYAFVILTVKVVGALILRLPSKHIPTLIEALGAFKNEMDFFKHHANERSITLQIELPDSSPLKSYIQHADSLINSALNDSTEFFRLLVFHYMAERCYYDSWVSVNKDITEYAEFRNRWASDDFKAYVNKVGDILEEEYKDEFMEAAQKEANYVIQAEQEFWNYLL